MKAIVIPGMNDMNKGDQALIWESVRLVEDTGLFSTVKVMSNGDTPEEVEALCRQSRRRGIKLVYNILPHPRRGKHEEDFREGLGSNFRLIRNAVKDFVALNFLLFNLRREVLLSVFFDQNVLHTLREFRSADIIFVKGGGFIHSYGEISAPYLMWFFLFYVRLAKKLNKNVVVLPNSYGPFKGYSVKSQVKNALKEADIIYAREQQSAKELGKLLKRSIPVEKDLGFFLKKGTSSGLQKYVPVDFFAGHPKKVGITVRPWRFPGTVNGNAKFGEYIKSVAKLAEYITDKGDKVLFFNQAIGPNSHEDDRIAIAEVLYLLKGNKNVFWVNENFTCEELQSLYAELDFMVGTRFHSVIFALTGGVPSMAIGYGGNKARGIMSDFGLKEYNVPIDSLNTEILISTFDQLVVNADEVRKQLKKLPGQLEDSRNHIIQKIKDIYSQPQS